MTFPLVKKSLKWAAAVIGGISTVMGVADISLSDILGSCDWFARFLIISIAFSVLGIAAGLIIYFTSKNGVSAVIGDVDVEIKVGNLFDFDGVKVIPFDEYFDTVVDDRVISKNSLNGIFLERYVDNADALQRVILNDQHCVLGKPAVVNDRLCYPLGTVKSFNDYALLAFTHMDEFNRSHLGRGQYEECLLNMWVELNRVYAGNRVILPLLGSGITRFKDGDQPSEDDLLKCMLCTLRASGSVEKVGVMPALG